MQTCNTIYYSTVHWRLNMFRAAYRSSLGALTVFAALVKSEWERLSGNSVPTQTWLRLQIQLELLMMSGMPLETCWAFNERWNNKSITRLHLVGCFYWDRNLVMALRQGPEISSRACLWVSTRTRHRTRCWLANQRLILLISRLETPRAGSGLRNPRPEPPLGSSSAISLPRTLFSFWGSVKSTGYSLHSPVSPSLSLPCVTVCHHISTGL